MNLNSVLLEILISVAFFFFGLKKVSICQKLSLNINNSSVIVYEANDKNGCNLLFSSYVDISIKCLVLCQTTRCGSLNFDKKVNNCTIIDPMPNLIKYDSIPNLNLTYKLSSFLNIGDTCLFNFTCSTLCDKGKCICLRDKQKYFDGLINEWTFNNTLKDSVRCNDLTAMLNATFYQETPNRYSGYLPFDGFYLAPPDVYFDGDFTITVMALLMSNRAWARVLDFSVNGTSENIVFALSNSASLNFPAMQVFNGSKKPTFSPTSNQYNTGTWVHLTALLKGTQAIVYSNCSLVYSQTQYVPANVVRQLNYIGYNKYIAPFVQARYRNLRIYRRALSQSELCNEMNSEE